MRRRLAALLCSLSILGSVATAADPSVLAQYYGDGVHSYYAGNLNEAFESFSAAISGGSDDPRPYYFRGLTYLSMGREPEAMADFQQGAELEANDMTGFYQVGKSLERVQGSRRVMLEKYRAKARVALFKKTQEAKQRRYELARQNEAEMRREVTLPKTETPSGLLPKQPSKAPAGADPFGTTPAAPPAADPFGGAPAAPAEKPLAPPAEDPFGAAPNEQPKVPAAEAINPPAADPFGGPPAADPAMPKPTEPTTEEPKPADPAPPAADPFGGPPAADPAMPKPTEPTTEEPKPADPAPPAADPFGGPPTAETPKPADPTPPATEPAAEAPKPTTGGSTEAVTGIGRAFGRMLGDAVKGAQSGISKGIPSGIAFPSARGAEPTPFDEAPVVPAPMIEAPPTAEPNPFGDTPVEPSKPAEPAKNDNPFGEPEPATPAAPPTAEPAPATPPAAEPNPFGDTPAAPAVEPLKPAEPAKNDNPFDSPAPAEPAKNDNPFDNPAPAAPETPKSDNPFDS